MATDTRFQTFGQVAQKANPQQSDPAQNRNVVGFPTPAKKPLTRFSDMRSRLQPQPKPPGTLGPIPSGPVAEKPLRFSQVPSGPIVSQPPQATPASQPPQDPALAETEAAQQARAEKTGIGNYVQGGYQPIAEEAQWGGPGYSGVDPREVGVAAAKSSAGAPPAPGAQGGKAGGKMAQAAEGEGFIPPGAAGGKSGGAPPTDGGAPGPAAGGAPEPGSNVVPAGDIGNTGVDPNKPIQWDDTGNYDPVTGFSDPFTTNYNIQEGSAGGRVLGHEQNPEALARLQQQADRRKQEWVDAGGNAQHFQAFNPTDGDFANNVPGWANMTAEQKWQARGDERMKFYNQQIGALRGASNPGVQN